MNEARPLVYASTPALRDAQRLLGDHVVIENVVGDAISAGFATFGRAGVVRDPAGAWLAHVKREPGRLRPRPRAWVVIAIEPTT